MSILGIEQDELLGLGPTSQRRQKRKLLAPKSRKVRYFLVQRSVLALELVRDVEQIVLVGAGLDTSFVANEFPRSMALFELDLPETQRWKRERLKALCIRSDHVRFVEADLEVDNLASKLSEAGFDCEKRAFFLMLGLVPYLTVETFAKTLAGCGKHADVVFDYGEPPQPDDKQFERRAKSAAAVGEAWISFFKPAELAAWLEELGFQTVKNYG